MWFLKLDISFHQFFKYILGSVKKWKSNIFCSIHHFGYGRQNFVEQKCLLRCVLASKCQTEQLTLYWTHKKCLARIWSLWIDSKEYLIIMIRNNSVAFLFYCMIKEIAAINRKSFQNLQNSNRYEIKTIKLIKKIRRGQQTYTPTSVVMNYIHT